MEFNEVIRNRFSCKKFSDQQISADQLNAILEAGRLAPTAKNLQEQHVYVVQSEEGIAKIDKATPCRYGAPTALIVTFDKTNVYVYPGEKLDSGIEDATIVATHMILAAENEGVNSCWINHADPDILAEEFGFGDNEQFLMILDLGFAKEGVKPLPNHSASKELSELVTFI